MKVTITAVSQDHRGITVFYRCSAGGSVARWNGDAPVVGSQYDVEFEIEDVVRLGENASLVDPAVQAEVGVEGDTASFVGAAERIDDDGVIFFRLAPDCLMMVDSVPGQVPIAACLRLRAPVDHVMLNAIGY